MQEITLVEIDADGQVDLREELLSEAVKQNCAQMAPFYAMVGFERPWIGYLSVSGGQVVGGGAFKGAPRDGSVEIAYYTDPAFEGQGYATATAGELIRIAQRTDPNVLVTAQTLPEPSASTRILKKHGFVRVAEAIDDEVGTVWEWHLPKGATTL